MKQNLRFIYSFFAIATVGSLFLSYSGGVDFDCAGAPGEGTCANCHGGGAGGGSVQLTNVPTSFVRGQTYPLTLTLNHPSAVAGAFQIVATNGSSSAMVGSFSAPTGTLLNSSNRLTHSAPRSFSGGGTSWTFNWVAPTSGAPANVVFYYVGNAVNGTGGTGGDAVLSGSTSAALPVELLSFSAKMGNNQSVNLSWATASERNSRHFNVERSLDNQKFDVVGQLKSVGTSNKIQNYQFEDNASNLSNNVVYYRLQQEDADGKTTVSKTISVDIESKSTLKVYPSLAQRGAILQIETLKNAIIEVVNVNGQVVQTIQKSALTNEKTTINLSTSDLPSGRYFVRFIGNGLVKTGSFIVL
jgi:hypothetical protein